MKKPRLLLAALALLVGAASAPGLKPPAGAENPRESAMLIQHKGGS